MNELERICINTVMAGPRLSNIKSMNLSCAGAEPDANALIMQLINKKCWYLICKMNEMWKVEKLKQTHKITFRRMGM